MDSDGPANAAKKSVRVERGVPTVNWSVTAIKTRSAIESTDGASVKMATMESRANQFARKDFMEQVVRNGVIARILLSVTT